MHKCKIDPPPHTHSAPFFIREMKVIVLSVG